MANENNNAGNVTRRGFVGGVALAGIGAMVGGAVAANYTAADERKVGYEQSQAYLLVDTKKCAGCRTCMSTCSLVHYGFASLSLSRIQVHGNSFNAFPDDIGQAQCHQCPYPSCVAACPVGAMHVDPETGVRMVDDGKCIGCEACINACPYTPSRVQWNYLDKHAQKCDLCKNTPYWNETGGPDGRQACMEVCPMQAISITHEMPKQDTDGYEVNLRNQYYASINYPVDDAAKQIPAENPYWKEKMAKAKANSLLLS